jgi:hypothetical protein
MNRQLTWSAVGTAHIFDEFPLGANLKRPWGRRLTCDYFTGYILIERGCPEDHLYTNAKWGSKLTLINNDGSVK